MKDEMQAKLLEWMTKGGEFVEREAPQLANEIVTFWIIESWIQLIACSVVAVCSLLVTVFGARYLYKKDILEFSPLLVISGCLAILTPAFAVDGLIDLSRGYYAPRTVIMQEIGRYV